MSKKASETVLAKLLADSKAASADELEEKIYGPRGTKIDENVVPPPIHETSRKISVLQDPLVGIEELYLSVFIVGHDPYDERLFGELFATAFCSKAESLDKADFVLFTGGADVSPELYGEIASSKTHSSPVRDLREVEVYLEAVAKGIPMVGVCRGFQFLHVMNGGHLYQDVDNHGQSHYIFDHEQQERIENASSTHHQSCIRTANIDMTLVASTNKSRARLIRDGLASERGGSVDVEAAFYRRTCCFGVQGHPEYSGFPGFSKWFMKKLREYLGENPDLHYDNKMLRIKPDILAQRGDVVPMTVLRWYERTKTKPTLTKLEA